MSNPSLNAAERRFVRAAIPMIYAGEGGSLEEGFVGLSAPLCDRLARAISDKLAQHAAVTRDWSWWAEAQWHLRLPALREAAQPFRERLDAIARATRRDRAPDPRRRELARAALRLLRAGASGRELLARLDDLNCALPEPLPPDAIGTVALWAAKTVREGAHAA